MRYLIKIILDKFTFFILFFFNLTNILLNIKKIINADLIINQNMRLGFGNIFMSIDLSQRLFKKKILFISFFDETRFHNEKIFDFLNAKKIILKTSIYFKKKFGEYERHDQNITQKENPYQKILSSIINYFKSKKCKLLNIPELYELANKKIKKKHMKKYNLVFSKMRYLNYYYYLIDKKPKLRINFKDPVIKKLLKAKGSTKSVCIYIRKKSYINKYTKNYTLYAKAIKYFNKKKFTIYIVGEIDEFVKKYKKLAKSFNTPIINGKFDKNINLGMQLICDYYLGDSGGGSWFAMYKKASILIGSPEFYVRPNTKAFNYQLYYKNKKVNRKSYMYKKIKNKIIQNDDVGHPKFLNSLGVKVMPENENKIMKSIKKIFV